MTSPAGRCLGSCLATAFSGHHKRIAARSGLGTPYRRRFHVACPSKLAIARRILVGDVYRSAQDVTLGRLLLVATQLGGRARADDRVGMIIRGVLDVLLCGLADVLTEEARERP